MNLDNKTTNETENHKMSVLEHLNELRYRLFSSLIVITICFFICFNYSNQLINILKLPAGNSVVFIQISPGEIFFVSIEVAFYTSIYLSLPIIFYHLARFIIPALKKSELKLVIPLSIAAFLCFSVGIIFGYYIALPLTLNFLVNYGADIAKNAISISKYMSFIITTLLLMGVLFQLPLFLVFLSLINLINSEKLVSCWRHIVLASFILGAILAPTPDPLGQTVVALIILLLYGLSFILLKLLRK